MIRELLAHGADVNAHSNLEKWERQTTAEPREKWLPLGSMTPLLFATREGCTECAKVLVDAGADLNAADPDGITPLDLGAHQRTLRRRRIPHRQGRGREPVRQDRPHGALRRRGRPLDAVLEPAVAQGVRRRADEPRHREQAAGARRERQRAAEDGAALPDQGRSRQRHHADHRHDAAAARRQGRRRRRRARAPRQGRRSRSSSRATGINAAMAAAGLGTKEEDGTGPPEDRNRGRRSDRAPAAGRRRRERRGQQRPDGAARRRAEGLRPGGPLPRVEGRHARRERPPRAHAARRGDGKARQRRFRRQPRRCARKHRRADPPADGQLHRAADNRHIHTRVHSGARRNEDRR